MRRSPLLSLPFLALLPITSLYAQWIQQPFPSSEYLWKVRFTDANTGWVLGQDYIYKTTDGGTNWTQQDSTNGGGYALVTLDENTVMYTRWNDEIETMRRSTDGGTTWETVDSSMIYYADYEFIDSLAGFAAGGIERSPGAFNPVVRKTTDGGSTWTTVWSDSIIFSEVEGIYFPDEFNGWLVTYWGYVFKTVDGGMSWYLAVDLNKPYKPLRDIQFTSIDSGCAVGGLSGDKRITRTTDGGNTWVDTVSGGASMREINFVTPDVGWVVGPNYTPNIERTTDGGLTWEPQLTTPPNSFYGFESISMVDANIGWAVGGYGVYMTTTGGVTSVEATEGIPRTFSLAQNYPNPFNPEAQIRYQISDVGWVRLAVFDLLGREIVTLVNERKEPGTYDIKWSAAGLPSGVYVYRMSAGNLTESKKAIVIK